MKLYRIVVLFIMFLILFYCLMSFKIFIIASGSMEPTLNVNELIFVKSQSNYKVGDIITFYDNTLNSTTTHRITTIDENEKITTKGDNNNTEDFEKITKDKIIGKVVFSSMILGLIFKSSFTIPIITFLIIICILYFLKTIFEIKK